MLLLASCIYFLEKNNGKRKRYKPFYNENREYENNINKFRIEDGLTFRRIEPIAGIMKTYLWYISQGYVTTLNKKYGKD